MKVNRDDFLSALDEVKPAFGVSDKELEVCVQNGIIKWSPVIEVRPDKGRNLWKGRFRTDWRKFFSLAYLI